MMKFGGTALLILFSFLCFGQRTVITDKVVVKQELKLNGTPVSQIDTSLTGATHDGLPTTKAVENAIAASGSATPDTITFLIQDSILIQESEGLEVDRDTIRLQTDSGDNLGDHTAAQAINLNGNFLSGDGDNEGVYVDSDGDVGVNNNNPLYHFHLTGTGAVLFPLGTDAQRPINALGLLRGSSTGADIEWSDGTDWWKIPKSTASSYATGSVLFAGDDGGISEENSNLFWSTSSGIFSVGTNTPSGIGGGVRTVHIQGSGGGGLRLQSDSGTLSGFVYTYGGSPSGMYVGTSSNHNLYLQQKNLIRATINANGFLGINTTAPQQMLHVQGAARIVSSSGTATSIMGRNTDGDVSTVTPLSGSGAPASTPLFIGQLYIDTAGSSIYMAAGVSSSGDWKQISN